jgi:hypothetical protein
MVVMSLNWRWCRELARDRLISVHPVAPGFHPGAVLVGEHRFVCIALMTLDREYFTDSAGPSVFRVELCAWEYSSFHFDMNQPYATQTNRVKLSATSSDKMPDTNAANLSCRSVMVVYNVRLASGF